MAFTTTIPGLPGGPLVTTYPIRMNLIAIDGYQRTGQPARTPRRSVQHGTANDSNASAWNEAQYFVDGAEGRQASAHAFADDTEVVIGVPLDEVTFQAADGAGPGNMNGLSCEMVEATAIWNSVGRRDRLIAIAADFMGRCAARFGIAEPEQHFDFNWVQCCSGPCDVLCDDRHDCPKKLRHTIVHGQPAWDVYVDLWRTAKADELAHPFENIVPANVPDFIDPDVTQGYPGDHPFEFENATAYGCLREWTVKMTTPRRFTARLDSEKVGLDLQAGDKFPGSYIFKVDEDWWVLTRMGTRVAMDDLAERVTVPDAG